MPRYHFSGIAGAGMNPLAQLMRARGHDVQGSDRSLDQGKNVELAERLRRLGITLLPHDGTAVTDRIARFVYSTAVEAATPEMRAARALGLEMVPRPALLAEVVNAGQPGIAIAGTSGKSTVTGMLGWVLRECGVTTTVVGGAALVGEGTSGCFIPGPADGPVVAEACESDGTLVGYRPTIGLIHNVSRDHDELEPLRRQFATFASQSRRLLVNARCAEAAALGRRFKALTYGLGGTDAALEVASVGPARARGALKLASGHIALDVPQPGLHNLENAAAATLAAIELGLDAHAVSARLREFPGVARRFEVVGVTGTGIRVVDDYAHNADKLRAAITAAQAGAARVVAVFQPHGFGPARFLRPDLKALLPAFLRPADRFCYAEIYYAGGTVAKDISSRLLAEDLPPSLACGYAPDHEGVRRWVAAEAKPGDTVLILGARDPDLPALARSVFESLAASAV
ncbi:MAG: UDP-N-acetylmuramate--alanine ligase [Candidatus Rokubacteria bacterium]|nr:UDP-N-acetylmuramate--alanine ligase [Candidatus Rokubacteria bacterium]